MYEAVHSSTDDIIEEYIRISGKYGLNISIQEFILLRQQAVRETNGILHGNSVRTAPQTPPCASQTAPEQTLGDTSKESPKKAKRTPKKAYTTSTGAQNGDEKERDDVKAPAPPPSAQAAYPPPQAPQTPQARPDPMKVLSMRKDALNM